MKTTSLSAVIASLLTSGSLLCAAPASAQQSAQSVDSIYIGGGPFGVGIGYGRRLSERWVGRLVVSSGNFGGYEDDMDVNDVRYDATLDIKPGVSALADFYPVASSGWRITGGLIYAPMENELVGRPESDGNYRLNGRTYSAAQVGRLSGTMKYNPVSLYLGGGWESQPIGTPGWRFTADLGLFYAGEADATLDATGAANNAALRNDLNAERSDLEKHGVGIAAFVGAAFAF